MSDIAVTTGQNGNTLSDAAAGMPAPKESFWDRIGKGLSGAAQGVGNLAKGAAEGIGNTAEDAWNTAKGLGEGIGSGVSNAAGEVGKFTSGAAGAAKNQLGQIVEAAKKDPAGAGLLLSPIAAAAAPVLGAIFPPLGIASLIAAGAAPVAGLIADAKKNRGVKAATIPTAAGELPTTAAAPTSAPTTADMATASGTPPGKNGTEAAMAGQLADIPSEPPLSDVPTVDVNNMGYPDIKAQLEALGKMPREAFGGRPGALGGLRDAVQSALLGYSGNYDKSPAALMTQNRAQAAQNVMGQAIGYKYGSTMQRLNQQFQMDMTSKLLNPQERAMKYQDYLNQLNILLPQMRAAAQQYPTMLQYLQNMLGPEVANAVIAGGTSAQPTFNMAPTGQTSVVGAPK